jgi:hypothetical protein
MSVANHKVRLPIPVHRELYENFLRTFATAKERKRATRRINNAIARMLMEKGVRLSDAVFTEK